MKRNKNLFLDTHSAENTSKITWYKTIWWVPHDSISDKTKMNILISYNKLKSNVIDKIYY